MKTHQLKLSSDFLYDLNLIIETLQPLCHLISVYDGPILKIELFQASVTNADILEAHISQNNYSIEFIYDQKNLAFNFTFLKKNEKLLHLLTSDDGITRLDLSDSLTNLIELEVLKSLTPHFFNQEEQNLKEQKVHEALEKAYQKEQERELHFQLKSGPEQGFTERFVRKLNLICQLISNNSAPQFDYQGQLNFEFSQNNYWVEFTQRDEYTGHYNMSRNTCIYFKLFHNHSLLINADFSYNTISISIYIPKTKELESKIFEITKGVI